MAKNLSFLAPLDDGLHRLTLQDGRKAIVKRRRDMPPDFFAAEARGLQALREAGGLRVPQMLALGDDWIVLEDLGSGTPGPSYQAQVGLGLARQHAARGDAFGFDADGWCGDSLQDNTRDADGHRFFAERRLLPQARRACDGGLLDADDLARVERLCSRLRELIPLQPSVLLHGDLWQGNLHTCGNGEPALIDAGAVHFGWAEAELAMLLLFGAPSQALFDAYAEAAPLDRGWRDRAPLYNLYHLLNHLNLFGNAYRGRVRQVSARFC